MAPYLVAGLLSLVACAVSGALTFMNPVSLLLGHAVAPLVRLLGRQPSIHGFSSVGGFMAISILWPLFPVPLHWLNYRVLHGNHWTYAGGVAGAELLLAFVVLMKTSGPASV